MPGFTSNTDNANFDFDILTPSLQVVAMQKLFPRSAESTDIGDIMFDSQNDKQGNILITELLVDKCLQPMRHSVIALRILQQPRLHRLV